jgi:uncharacterized protein (TIGR03435 family)
MPREEEMVGQYPANFRRGAEVCCAAPPNIAGRQSWGAKHSDEFSCPLTGGYGSPGPAVVDQTGLTGNFDFALERSHEPAVGGAPVDDPTFLTFQEAVQEQLGLNQVLAIDRIHSADRELKTRAA